MLICEKAAFDPLRGAAIGMELLGRGRRAGTQDKLAPASLRPEQTLIFLYYFRAARAAL